MYAVYVHVQHSFISVYKDEDVDTRGSSACGPLSDTFSQWNIKSERE